MRKATLHKFIVILLSAAALSGGIGVDAAYALGGGGFGAGQMGTGQVDGLGSGPMVAGFGRSHVGMAGGFQQRACRQSRSGALNGHCTSGAD